MTKLRIYVAGSYTPVGCSVHEASQVVQRNIDRTIEAANIIHDKGHYAFVPHLAHYLHIHYSCKSDRGLWYYNYDNTFLDLWANSFLYLMPSFGADEELKRFKEKQVLWKDIYPHPMPIFYSTDEIPSYKENLLCQ